MLHGIFALLPHDILPRGPSGLAALAALGVIAGLAALYAYHAVEARLELGAEDLFELFRTVAVASLVLSAVTGLFAGSLIGGVLAIGVPALAGLGASTLVIHRRAMARVLPGTRESLPPDTVMGEVAIAAVAFGGGALGMLALPWLLMGIALA